MRTAVMGAIVGASLSLAVFGFAGRSEIIADQHSSAGHSSTGRDLITFTAPGDKVQQLIVIEPGQKVVAVYHVDSQTGKVALKSVRQFHWDLQIADFNGEKPLPREIRQMLEQK